jgi:hypothetical protein
VITSNKRKKLVAGLSTALAISGIMLGGSMVEADSSTPIPDNIREKIETLKVDIDHPELKAEKENLNVVALKQAVASQKLESTQKTVTKLKEETKKAEDDLTAAKKSEEELQKQIKELEEKVKEKEERETQASKRQSQSQSRSESPSNQTSDESYVAPASTNSGSPYFGADGLLVESATGRAQDVINHLLAIPGHANGSWYHAQYGLDAKINSLSVEEAVYVIHRIEGAGFGQTGDGYAGYDTPASHRNFLNNQVNNRFGGDIWALLRSWGTYSYGGY